MLLRAAEAQRRRLDVSGTTPVRATAFRVVGGAARRCSPLSAFGPLVRESSLRPASLHSSVVALCLSLVVGVLPGEAVAVASPLATVDVRPSSNYYAAPQQSLRRRSGAAGPSRAAIDDALRSIAAARALQDAGEYALAADTFARAADAHADLALSHAARIGHALLNLQLGRNEEALAELLDQEREVGAGNAPLHAAIAAALHATCPESLGRAEAEWAAATALSPRFGQDDAQLEALRWPPAAVEALKRFRTLS